jgi:L-ribulose-5-phosphate 3-epimerase
MDGMNIHRRDFMKKSMAAVAGTSLMGISQDAQGIAPPPPLLKSVQRRMLPKDMPFAQQCELARRCGFEGMEVEQQDIEDSDQAQEMKKVARDLGVPIHSVVFGWASFTEPNKKTAQTSLEQMKQTLRHAQAVGADAVLLVPGRVTESVSYRDAYQRSQEYLHQLIPVAQETAIVVAVENVWNKFLLSPLEFARYIDEFESEWIHAYFDVGNVVIHGFSQDWIRTLGKRIVKIHLKDFKREGYQWTNLRDGDVNWKQVLKALREIEYKGFLTPELKPGDENYLMDISRRIDLIIAGK